MKDIFFKKRFIYIFSIIFLTSILFNSLKTSADYDLKNFTQKNKSFPRIKLQEEDVRYPMNFNSDIGDFIVVKVFGSGSPGNGVLIAQKKEYYYVFTARHVVEDVLEGDDIEVQTLDGKYHIGKLLKKSINYDSALIKFKSKDYYYTAFIRPDVTPYKGLAVELVGYSLPSNAVEQINLRKTFGTITGVLDKNKDGYTVLYSNATNIGMSGGAVLTYPLDGAAFKFRNVSSLCNKFITPSLLAIHGRGEEYIAGGKSGVNLGISIHDLLVEFRSILLKEDIETLPEETNTRIWKDGCVLSNSAHEKYFEKIIP